MDMKKYNSAVNRIKADERLYNRIYDSINHSEKATKRKKHKKIRLTSAAAIAAAVMSLCGITVFAANSGLIEIIFGKEDDRFDYMTGEFKNVSIEILREGVSVEPIGYTSDGYNTFFVLKVDLPEKLPDGDKFYQGMQDGYGVINHKQLEKSLKSTDSNFTTMSVYTEYLKADKDSLYMINCISTDGKVSGEHSFAFFGGNLRNGEQYLYNGNLFYIEFDAVIKETESMELCGEYENGYMDSMTVSECGLIIRRFRNTAVTGYRKEIPYFYDETIYVTLKNGDTVFCENRTWGTASEYSGGIDMTEQCIFEYPIQLSEIASVTVGDVTYPVE